MIIKEVVPLDGVVIRVVAENGRVGTVDLSRYLDSPSVISYLTARVSRDLVSAARQQITQEWWDNSCQNFELFV